MSDRRNECTSGGTVPDGESDRSHLWNIVRNNNFWADFSEDRDIEEKENEYTAAQKSDHALLHRAGRKISDASPGEEGK